MSTDNLIPYMALCDLCCISYTGCNITVGTKVNQGIYPDRQMDRQTRRECIKVIKLNCFLRKMGRTQTHTHRDDLANTTWLQ